MITRIPTMLAAAPKPRIASLHQLRQSKAIKPNMRISLHPQRQLRPYSSPPKTYFQPGDPLNSDSQPPNYPPSPPLPPKTYFQPLDSQNVEALGPNSQIYNIPVQPPPKKPRSLRTPIFAASFLLVGLLGGSLASLAAIGDTPEPGSKEDLLAMEKHEKNFNKLPIIQDLSENPDWAPCELKKDKYINKTLGGVRGVELSKTFYNQQNGEVVSVIRFGRGTSGWPTVAHGGVTATMCCEVAAACAERQWHDVNLRPVFQGALYATPISTLGFYIIVATPQLDLANEDTVSVVCNVHSADDYTGEDMGIRKYMSSGMTFEKSAKSENQV